MRCARVLRQCGAPQLPPLQGFVFDGLWLYEEGAGAAGSQGSAVRHKHPLLQGFRI